MSEMSESPKVSVVMPVYNTAPYLRQCLDSVVNQTLEDIEIICVDDGSTDDSLAILEEYAAADPRVRVLQQQNQYAGVARNNGMAQARGKYLMFWDSDDYFDVTALEKMYNQCEADQADICVCGGKRFFEDSQRELITNTYLKMSRIPEKVPFNRHTNPDNILRFTETATWNKLYRHAFVKERSISFKPLRSGNDVFFSVLALCEADCITIVDEHLVCYRKGRTGSLINTLSSAPLALPQAWEDVREELVRRNILPEWSFENRAAAVVRHAFSQFGTWDSFMECFGYLQEGGLERLGLTEKPEGYYDSTVSDFMRLLLDGDPHTVLLFLYRSDHTKLVEKNDLLTQRRADINRIKRKLSDSRAEAKSREKELAALKQSPYARIGRALTAPVRSLGKATKRPK